MRLYLLTFLLLMPAWAVGQDASKERPNILFLFADDHRPDAVEVFGNSHIRTPHINHLARRGFRFRSNYCMGSVHGAVCQPSRAMLHAGRSLYRVPLNLKGVPVLGALLGKAGYRTFGTGKWHNGTASFCRSFQEGQAVFFGGMSNHLKVPIRSLKADGSLDEKRIADGFSTELFAEATIRFLESLSESDKRPFFAYVSFTTPHDPRQPPESWRQRYYDARPPLPRNFMPQHPFHNGWLTGRDEVLAAWPRERSVISDQLCEYYGLISHMDEQIGRILAALKDSGRADNTLVVFTADHGLAVGSHGLLGKQSVYEHSMGCPLILAGPGVPRGESRALTYLYDLMPTLLGQAGVSPPEGVEGEDLRPIWSGEKATVRSSLYLTYENGQRAVRDARYKYLRYPLIDHELLFDLEADPDELVDLAKKPEHAQRKQALKKLMEDWHARLDDPHPLKVAEPRPKEIDLSGRTRKPDRHQPRWIVEKYFDR